MTRRHPGARHSLTIESLEDRRLLAADFLDFSLATAVTDVQRPESPIAQKNADGILELRLPSLAGSPDSKVTRSVLELQRSDGQMQKVQVEVASADASFLEKLAASREAEGLSQVRAMIGAAELDSDAWLTSGDVETQRNAIWFDSFQSVMEDISKALPTEVGELTIDQRLLMLDKLPELVRVLQAKPTNLEVQDVLGPLSPIVRPVLDKSPFGPAVTRAIQELAGPTWLIWNGFGVNGVREIPSDRDRPAQIVGLLEPGVTEFVAGLNVDFDQRVFVSIVQLPSDGGEDGTKDSVSIAVENRPQTGGAISAGGVASSGGPVNLSSTFAPYVDLDINDTGAIDQIGASLHVSAGSPESTAYLGFRLTEVPEVFDTVKLELTKTAVSNPLPTIDVGVVEDGWDIEQLAWESQPIVTPIASAVPVGDLTTNPVSVDITDIARETIQRGDMNFNRLRDRSNVPYQLNDIEAFELALKDDVQIGGSLPFAGMYEDVFSYPADSDEVLERGDYDNSEEIDTGDLFAQFAKVGAVVGDWDFSGIVDFGDFNALSLNFGKVMAFYQDGDGDMNGLVDFTDFSILSMNFGVTAPSQRHPELMLQIQGVSGNVDFASNESTYAPVLRFERTVPDLEAVSLSTTQDGQLKLEYHIHHANAAPFVIAIQAAGSGATGQVFAEYVVANDEQLTETTNDPHEITFNPKFATSTLPDVRISARLDFADANKDSTKSNNSAALDPAATHVFMDAESALHFHGSDSNDQIVVTETSIAGTPFPVGFVRSVHVYGHDGNDSLDASLAAHVVALVGGSGNDVLKGGAQSDLLVGGDGDDYLYGREGNDELYGGFGNDRLYGQGGNDLLQGEAGGDWLYGQDGNDRFAWRHWG